MAGDSITITDFTDFNSQSGSGPYTFTTTVSMAYAGSIVVMTNASLFGTFGSSSTSTFELSIDGTALAGSFGTGTLAGTQGNYSASKDVSSGSRIIRLVVSGISGVTNPTGDCQMTIFRRYR